jgi:hypothetical protein
MIFDLKTEICTSETSVHIGLHSALSQKMATFITTAERTSNPIQRLTMFIDLTRQNDVSHTSVYEAKFIRNAVFWYVAVCGSKNQTAPHPRRRHSAKSPP